MPDQSRRPTPDTANLVNGLRAMPTDPERPPLKTLAAETGLAIATVSKEVNHFLYRFRKEIIVVEKIVNRAGSFLTLALMAAIERRAPERGQFPDSPDHVDLG